MYTAVYWTDGRVSSKPIFLFHLISNGRSFKYYFLMYEETMNDTCVNTFSMKKNHAHRRQVALILRIR